MSGEAVARGARSRSLRRAALTLGLQTGLAVALVVVALVGVALLVVLRSQHSAAVDMVTQTVRSADDVSDPPAGMWLVIQTPTRLVSSRGLPAGFPDRAAMARAQTSGPAGTTTRKLGGREYLVYTKTRGSAVVQGVLDLSAGHAERDRLVGALLLSGGLGLLLAAAAGAFLASRAMRPLASALALQRRFVADASHELRTPLTLLSTRAQLVQRGLRRHADPESLAADIDGLVTDAGNLAAVLEDLLLAADPRGTTPEELVDVSAVTEQVVAACRPAAEEAGLDLSCDATAEAVLVRAARGAMHRAITALVDNAIRHATSQVTVSVNVRGTQAVVSVSDDGAGIDADVLPRIFDRFESSAADQAHDAGPVLTGEQRRYGLGLALVSEVAVRHHGEVSAHNRVSVSGAGLEGATLELALPRAT